MRGAQGAADIWIVDTARGVPSRLTFSGGGLPVWAAGDDRVFFRGAGERTDTIFEKPSDGGGDERPLLASDATPDKSELVPQDVSPDGRYLLYAKDSDLWALPLRGESRPFGVATSSNFEEGQGQFSPDGKWIAYVSNENETARHQVWVRPFPGPGTRWQVSAEGGIYPRWQHEGKEIFYLSPQGQLMAVPIEAGSDEPTPVAGRPVALFQTTLATGAYILGAGVNARAQYDVARDGRFLMNTSVEEAPPIQIVLNWMASVS
jgi:Tol biopolymer transport system component